jgi:hypothetical protein
MWLTIYINRKSRPNLEHVKYKPFLRIDYDNWSYILTIFTHFFFWPRFLIAWFCITSSMIACAFVAIGHSRTQKPGAIRRWLFSRLIGLGGRGAMLSYGIFWCQKRKVEVDYTKWLGPEWKFDSKTSYEGAGTYVANHQSFADILI